MQVGPSQDQRVVRVWLHRLVRRERRLLASSALLRGIAWVGLVSGIAVVPPAFRWNRESAAFALAVSAGIGLWGALVLPLLRSWGGAGDVERQARLSEQAYPVLRGRMLAVVEAERRGARVASDALLERVRSRAARVVEQASSAVIHPLSSLRTDAATAAAAVLAALVCWVASPVGPLEAARWWAAGVGGDGIVADEAGDSSGPRARVGDIVLRYVYPDYTGLSPREVPNSTGDAHAPPGTVVYVRARSADPVEAAAIVAYGEPALEAVLSEEGRVVAGNFTVAVEPGTWEVVTYRSGVALRSKAFQIVPELDVAPQVQVDSPESRLEVAVDERITLPWRARDDYGVARVVVEIQGRELAVPLAVARERRAELDGRLVGRPRDWGLGPGDRATLVVAAWDNDAVSGSKAGRSRSIEIIVLGAAGVDRREDERQRELRDLFLSILADHLEDVSPVDHRGRPPTGAALAAWGERVSRWYEALESWRAEMHGDRPARTRRERLERDLLQRVAKAGTALIRFTQVAFDPQATGPAASADLSVILDLRAKAVEATEDAVLALDRMVQLRALRDVVDKAKALGELADEVMQSLAEGMSAQEMLTRLERLEQAIREVMQQAARMQEGGLREFVNQRGTEMSSLMEEIRKALEKGDTAEAQALMERLARELQQFSEGVEEQLNRRSEEGQEQMKEAQALQRELSALEQEQRKLQEETRAAREQADSAGAKRAQQLWEKLQEKAGAHANHAERVAGPAAAGARSFFLQQRAENGAERSNHLRDAVAARDLRASREGLDEARVAWMQARDAARGSGQALVPELGALEAELSEIDALLRQLEQQAQSTDPRAAQRSRELEQRQQQLEQRLGEAQKKAQEVARGMSTRPRGLEEGLEGAERAMEQAGRDLGQGRPMPAEGAQGSAAEQIREARESLEQAMRDQQSMQSAGSQSSGSSGSEGEGGDSERPGEGGGGDGDDGEDSSQPHDIEIPNPEQFRTPEEFRRELLEGMEGDVPEEYRELKRLYFEELVHQ
jgi:hypothetical protein